MAHMGGIRGEIVSVPRALSGRIDCDTGLARQRPWVHGLAAIVKLTNERFGALANEQSANKSMFAAG